LFIWLAKYLSIFVIILLALMAYFLV